ncbi:MAG: hypothetical protein ABR986_05050 [Methanomassiliicoccales archaeon]|jgi:hypothetical protein
MMEFFLSKVWLFVCGIAITAVLVLAFSGMDHSVNDDEAQRRVAQLADVLDSVSESPNNVQMTITVSDYLPEGRSVIMISEGFVSLESGIERRYAPLHSATILTDCNGIIAEDLTLVHGDLLLVHKDPARKGHIRVQVAKDRTVSLTA